MVISIQCVSDTTHQVDLDAKDSFARAEAVLTCLHMG